MLCWDDGVRHNRERGPLAGRYGDRGALCMHWTAQARGSACMRGLG